MGRGLLVFKGDKPKKKKKKSKHEPRGDHDDETAAAKASVAAASALPETAESDQKPAAAPRVATTTVTPPKIHTGRGTITTSGTVVTGHDTKFTKELRQGDALLVQVGQQDEMRVITMLLSDISINLSSPFSENMVKPVSFRYIPKPRNTQREAKQAREKAAREAVEEEANASGTGTSQELVYRERTAHGSYRIRRKQFDTELSREELLNMRAKKASDKYC
uniref:Uncharacterized protein n=1 Tax=Amphora coffeiformis TaxID=265554 RepID=A0A7S3PDW8_9STRA